MLVVACARLMVYYPYMASIVGKKRGEATYYYLVESARVGGRPGIVSRDTWVLPRSWPRRCAVAGWGCPTASGARTSVRSLQPGVCWKTLAWAAIIDEAAGARRSDAGASAGTYLVLATLNRLADPCSKRKIRRLVGQDGGARFARIPASVCDHRRFWDAMHAVPLEALEEISQAIAMAIVAASGLDCSSVALDMTNFATFIDTGNEKAPIAQRGKAKQKRTDLRLVGLGLVVTRDGGIPLAWRAYPGDKPDVTQDPPDRGAARPA